jgi:hypothetical protein
MRLQDVEKITTTIKNEKNTNKKASKCNPAGLACPRYRATATGFKKRCAI